MTKFIIQVRNDGFKVDFAYFPSHHYEFIEYFSHGLELVGNRVVVRRISQDALRKQIQYSQAYLLGSIDPQYYGVYKFYNADLDQAETLLRTVYSASTLYTLLNIQSVNVNAIPQHTIQHLSHFIVSNQILAGPNKGAFYYGYDPNTHAVIQRLVVGTAAKSIFSLLALHARDPHEVFYLDRAKLAGDWLLTRIEQTGQVNPVLRWKDSKWQSSERQSLLYSGQVLSALSRLSQTTHETRYAQAAKKIADHFVTLVEQDGSLLGDAYRPANSISTSWVLMSLIDYAQIDPTARYQSTLWRLAQTIIQRQIVSVDDTYNHGRYLDAMTASGNGWINEVMGTTYAFCMRQPNSPNCQTFYAAMLRTSRWLLQNAYSPENRFIVKNPQRALGGFVTNFRSETVRTDAVCHAVNSLLMLLSATKLNHVAPNDSLLALPERPLREILPLLRAGSL